nr:chloride channel protein [Candidatus Njordarchaeota archaeon]
MSSLREHTWLRNFKGFMRSRRVKISMLAVLVGVGGGIGAVVLKSLISFNSSFFFGMMLPQISFIQYGYNLSVILLPALGAVIAGLIGKKFSNESKGHGIPNVIESVTFKGGRMRYRVAATTTIMSSIVIGSGGSAGREGPIAQIGASIGSTTGQVFNLSDKDVELLVVCGFASGIAATFNAPLGGVVFGLEILYRRFELVEAVPVLLACAVGTAMARIFLGNFISFPTPVYQFPPPYELIIYAIFGLIAGGIGALWVRFYYSIERLFKSMRSVPLLLRVTLGGLLTGLIVLPFFTLSLAQSGDKTGYGLFGVGYEGIVLLLAGGITVTLAILLAVVKMFATSFTIGSGSGGGLLVPALYIGSMFGGAFGLGLDSLVPGLISEPYAFATVGAAALLGGAYGTPVAAMLIVPEMSMSYNLFLPLMLTCSLSHVTARKLLNGSTINTLALENEGIHLSQLTNQPSTDILEQIQVQEVMTKRFVNVTPETPVKEVSHLISSRGFGAYPVIKEGKLVGIVDYRDVIRISAGKTESTLVKDVMQKADTTSPDQTLAEAIELMYSRNVHRLVVVDQESKKPIGLLAHEDMVKGYESVRHEHPVAETNPFKRVKAAEAMMENPVRIKPTQYVKNLSKRFKEYPYPAYPVLDHGRLVGMLTSKELVAMAGIPKENLKVSDVMEKNPAVAFPDETLDQVLDRMYRFKALAIPVVERDQKEKLLGIITVLEIIKGYESEK